MQNVEFKNCGQRGFTAENDYGYSLVFENSQKIFNVTEDGDVTDVVLYDSKISKCSFNYNYNVALGSFGTSEVTFEVRLEERDSRTYSDTYFYSRTM